jgi:hypothetical protein
VRFSSALALVLNRSFFLSDILEIVTPIGVDYVALSSVPFFGSFVACLCDSSEGFLATLTPEGPEDSILTLDLSPGGSHNPSLRRGIISLHSSLETKLENRGTLFLPRNPPNQRLVKVIGKRSRPSSVLVSESIKPESPRPSREERRTTGRIRCLDVMNPGPEEVLETKNPTDESAGNGRNLKVGAFERELVIFSLLEANSCISETGKEELIEELLATSR